MYVGCVNNYYPDEEFDYNTFDGKQSKALQCLCPTILTFVLEPPGSVTGPSIMVVLFALVPNMLLDDVELVIAGFS